MEAPTVPPDDVIMTSLSADSVAVSRATRTVCCDVTTAAAETETLKSISASRPGNVSYVELAYYADATTVTSDGDGDMSTLSAGGNGQVSRDEVSRDVATLSIRTDNARDVTTSTSGAILETSESVAESRLVTVGYGLITRDVASSSQLNSSSWRRVTPSDATANFSSVEAPVVPPSDVTSPMTNISFTDSRPLFTNASRDHRNPWLPLALRSSADNASVSAAVGSNVADRRAGSGLLREEVATVGAAVAGVALFWSLLAFSMCVIVRVRKRKQRRRTRGSSDVDAQTAMMEAMVRAELARGRSRVSDSRVPTYVNVSELIPPSSSSCELDMSEFYHFVLDNNRSGAHGVWKKQYSNDVISGRPRGDHFARWQDGSRTIQTRGSRCLGTTTHWSNNCRQLSSHDDHYCLLNGTKDMATSALQCNGILTKVKCPLRRLPRMTLQDHLQL